MIIWLASYPKSGNTWLRSLIASYFYSKSGNFDFDLLNNIDQFPSAQFFERYDHSFSTIDSTSGFWIKEQTKINNDKKLRFLKTHNALCKINSNVFTDQNNSLGGIYIIRDPRNVISSLSHHYQLNLSEALNFMTDTKRALIEKKNNRYLGFVPILSWDLHQDSWVNCKKFPILVIRYEDLELKIFETFKKVIQFIINISNLDISFDEAKARNSISSCSFEEMQNLEKSIGFKESIINKKTGNKITFFNLGKKNNFRKLLDKQMILQLNKIYKTQLEKFNYE